MPETPEPTPKELAQPYWDKADGIWDRMRVTKGFFQYIVGQPTESPALDALAKQYETAIARAKELDPNWRIDYDAPLK